MPNRGVRALNVYSGLMVSGVACRLPDGASGAIFLPDLQIPQSSLIITSLFGDAARFRCGISCISDGDGIRLIIR